VDFGNTPVNDSIAIGDISQIGFNYRNNVPPKKLENFNSNSRQNSDIELKLKAGLNFISVLKEFCDKKFKKLDCIVDVSTNGGPNGGFLSIYSPIKLFFLYIGSYVELVLRTKKSEWVKEKARQMQKLSVVKMLSKP
jgi:hypothetical protein